jgi:N-hydroxyarylamine O-acetyltransferase
LQDLDAYLRRIGLARPARSDLVALRAIVFAHATHIPFENLDAWRGRAVDLDPAAVERKLVADGRGGWCFEQNGLLGDALRTLGFAVTDLAARVLWGRALDEITPRTHRLLAVDIDGTRHLADVGFGGLTLTGTLLLDEGREQATPHETCRLIRLDGDWLLQARVRDEWWPLYRFDLQPQRAVDFEAANFQLVHDPASRFTQLLACARATPRHRLTLRDLEFAVHHAGGRTERRLLAGVPELLQVLEREFGLPVDRIPGLAARAASLAAAAAPA